MHICLRRLANEQLLWLFKHAGFRGTGKGQHARGLLASCCLQLRHPPVTALPLLLNPPRLRYFAATGYLYSKWRDQEASWLTAFASVGDSLSIVRTPGILRPRPLDGTPDPESLQHRQQQQNASLQRVLQQAGPALLDDGSSSSVSGDDPAASQSPRAPESVLRNRLNVSQLAGSTIAVAPSNQPSSAGRKGAGFINALHVTNAPSASGSPAVTRASGAAGSMAAADGSSPSSSSGGSGDLPSGAGGDGEGGTGSPFDGFFAVVFGADPIIVSRARDALISTTAAAAKELPGDPPLPTSPFVSVLSIPGPVFGETLGLAPTSSYMMLLLRNIVGGAGPGAMEAFKAFAADAPLSAWRLTPKGGGADEVGGLVQDGSGGVSSGGGAQARGSGRSDAAVEVPDGVGALAGGGVSVSTGGEGENVVVKPDVGVAAAVGEGAGVGEKASGNAGNASQPVVQLLPASGWYPIPKVVPRMDAIEAAAAAAEESTSVPPAAFRSAPPPGGARAAANALEVTKTATTAASSPAPGVPKTMAAMGPPAGGSISAEGGGPAGATGSSAAADEPPPVEQLKGADASVAPYASSPPAGGSFAPSVRAEDAGDAPAAALQPATGTGSADGADTMAEQLGFVVAAALGRALQALGRVLVPAATSSGGGGGASGGSLPTAVAGAVGVAGPAAAAVVSSPDSLQRGVTPSAATEGMAAAGGPPASMLMSASVSTLGSELPLMLELPQGAAATPQPGAAADAVESAAAAAVEATAVQAPDVQAAGEAPGLRALVAAAMDREALPSEEMLQPGVVFGGGWGASFIQGGLTSFD